VTFMSMLTSVPRRSTVLLTAALATLLAATLFITVVATAAAATDVAGGAVILAVEGELLGPEPMPRDAEDNPARELAGYGDLEIPFTWGAAWLLTFLGLSGLAVMGIVYFRAVERPGAGDQAGARR
jgi:hypothetical protein